MRYKFLHKLLIFFFSFCLTFETVSYSLFASDNSQSTPSSEVTVSKTEDKADSSKKTTKAAASTSKDSKENDQESTKEKKTSEKNTKETSKKETEKETTTKEPETSLEGWPTLPKISGKTAIVMEADTGAILYSKNMDQKMYPASITKIMTAALVLEHTKMKETVVFSSSAVFGLPYGAAHIARDLDEELSVKDCLYALLLASANEVALALGEHVSGSTDKFAKLMNQKAEELGCKNTHFVNPNGLHDKNHYTTAYDMALITKYAISFPKFVKMAGTVRYTIPTTNKKDEELVICNSHQMLLQENEYYDKRVICGKTGYTDEAKNTLVTVAKKNGMTLICVILKSKSGHIYEDTKSLLDYGFKNFSKVKVTEEDSGDLVKDGYQYGIKKSGNILIPDSLKLSDLSPQITTKGKSSTVNYYYDKYLLGQLPLKKLSKVKETTDSAENAMEANGDVSDQNSLEDSKSKLISLLSIIVKILIVSVILLIIITIIMFIIRKTKKSKRNHMA